MISDVCLAEQDPIEADCAVLDGIPADLQRLHRGRAAKSNMKTANEPSFNVASLVKIGGMSATVAERVGTMRLRMRKTRPTTTATMTTITSNVFKT